MGHISATTTATEKKDLFTQVDDDDGALLVDAHEERNFVDQSDRSDRIRHRIKAETRKQALAKQKNLQNLQNKPFQKEEAPPPTDKLECLSVPYL
jgi:hypothetical protein